MIDTISLENGVVHMLDQTKLPREVVYVDCKDYHMVAEGIKKLWVRGAPAIGIAASMGIAIGANAVTADNYDDFLKGLEPVFNELLETRPTAVNIQWAVERTRKMLEERKGESVDALKTFLNEEAQRVLQDDIKINKTIGQYGAAFIKDGDTLITHCNAGSLATGGYGTATGPMRAADEQGKKIHVIADETRPVLQGCRLTAWELMQDNIPVTLITDNTAGAILRTGEIKMAIVGTDRTVNNGDVANKIGTYPLAVLCKENNVPFFVAAPLSSIDFTIKHGDDIPIEERGSEEVTEIFGVSFAPEGVKVRNIAFDVTPAKYITGIITEKGVFRPKDLHKLNEEGTDLESIMLRPEDL
ncbi:MAG: S-methyl-5-thioribose-1-phosphate isomerase [Nitrospira sp.]|nr:S-methyl-5-thioribose-1-phosphate isomerase [Nitrospira sp.]